jgi:hypothetical protein
MAKFKHIYIESLGSNIWVMKSSRRQYEESCKREFNLLPPKKEDDVCGTFEVFLELKVPIGIIWLKPPINEVDKAHEIFHAVHWICQSRGIYLNNSSEEIYAYLISYLTRKV